MAKAPATPHVVALDTNLVLSALVFAGGIFSIQGEAADVRRTVERSGILSALLIADEPMSPQEIAVATGYSRNSADQLLYKMGKAGEVEKISRGLYIHPERSDLRKIDKKVTALRTRRSGSSASGIANSGCGSPRVVHRYP